MHTLSQFWAFLLITQRVVVRGFMKNNLKQKGVKCHIQYFFPFEKELIKVYLWNILHKYQQIVFVWFCQAVTCPPPPLRPEVKKREIENLRSKPFILLFNYMLYLFHFVSLACLQSDLAHSCTSGIGNWLHQRIFELVFMFWRKRKKLLFFIKSVKYFTRSSKIVKLLFCRKFSYNYGYTGNRN